MSTNFVMYIYTQNIHGDYMRLATAESYAASLVILPALAKCYTGLFCLYDRGPLTITKDSETAKRSLLLYSLKP